MPITLMPNEFPDCQSFILLFHLLLSFQFGSFPNLPTSLISVQETRERLNRCDQVRWKGLRHSAGHRLKAKRLVGYRRRRDYGKLTSSFIFYLFTTLEAHESHRAYYFFSIFCFFCCCFSIFFSFFLFLLLLRLSVLVFAAFSTRSLFHLLVGNPPGPEGPPITPNTRRITWCSAFLLASFCLPLSLSFILLSFLCVAVLFHITCTILCSCLSLFLSILKCRSQR